MLEQHKKSNLEPHFKLADSMLDLRNMNTNVIIEQLENAIKLREMSVEQQLKKKLLK